MGAASAGLEAIELCLLAHPGRQGYSDQQSFRRQETSDSLAPGFLLVSDEHAIAARFKFGCCALHVVNVELEPRLRNREVARPGFLTEAGQGCVIQRPEGEALYSIQRLSMEITALLFFEPDAEGLLIKTLAGCSIANDWTKSGNKQNFDFCEFVHGDLPSGLDCM
jgi:hypothetical protein